MSGLRDTGGRRGAEEPLGEGRDLYRTVVEQSADAIWIFDAASKRVLESNASFKEMFGYTADDLAGMTNYDFIDHDKDSIDDTVARMAREAKSVPQERRYRKKDGTHIYVEVNGSPIAYRGGEAVCAVARDLTRRRRAEEAVRKSEERFRSLVQNASDVITLLDPDGVILYESPAVERLLGYGPEERVGTSAFAYMHGDDVERARASFVHTVGRRKSEPIVALRVRHKDGSWRHLEVTRTNLLGDPAVGAVVANSRDVTEREETRGALEESEGRFRSVVQNSSEIVKIVDADGTLKYASPAFERLLGYDPEEAVGMNVLDYVHPDDLPRVVEETERTMGDGGVGRNVSEYRFRHADGSWRYIEAAGAYLLDDPAVGGVVINARDVTQRKEAEARHREAEEKYRSIFENAAIGIFRTTPGGRYAEANPAAARILGYDSPEELVDRITDIGRQIYVDSDRRREFVGLMEEAGSVVEFESQMYREDGSTAWVSESARAVWAPDGTVLYYEGFSEDITARKRAEEELRRSEQRLRAVVGSVPVILFALDTDGVFTLLEGRGLEAWGAGTGDVVGSSFFDAVGETPQIEGAVRRALAGETVALTAQINGLTFDSWYSPILDAGGGVTGVIGVGADVTDRSRAQAALEESEERFRTAFEGAAVGVALIGIDRRYLGVNLALCEMLGYPEEEMLAKTADEINHPDDEAAVLEGTRRLLRQGGGSFHLEKRCVRSDGGVVWVLSSVSLVRNGEGEPGHFVTLYQDVTAHKKAEEALRESEAFHRAVIEQSVEAIYLFDPRTKEVLETNAAFEKLVGHPGADLLGMTIYDFLAHDRENVDLHVERHLIQEGRFVGERRYRRKDGRIVTVAASATMVPRRGAEVVCVVVRDISERKALEEQLRHQALYDSLTGLPNRVLLLDRLDQALGRSGRAGGQVAVLFVDLDDFKTVNDSLGHDAGNTLLSEVADRLGGCVRSGDTVGRLFGDEFAVLLEPPATVEDARLVAERAMECLERPFILDGQEVFTRCSIGIAFNDAAGDRPGDVLRKADLAMYAAKGRGKDSYEVYNPSMNTRALRRMELENDLRRAVEREEFEVHYQPIFRVSTGEVAGVEALARWRHPERGWIDPEDFIALAEQTGLVRPLGRWVLGSACRQTKAWRDRFPEKDLKVSVNFSTSQFDRQADSVPKVLSEIGLPPEALQLEITERAVMSNAEFALGKLQRLRDLGIGFAIDDYGTGYSCLYYLKRMPVNCLKIDRSFIAGLGQDRGDTAIVSGTIDLAHALGLEVVAEGVETEQQLGELERLGCDMAQGFLLSVPLRGEEIPDLLAR